MRTLLWLFFLFGIYLWISLTGNEAMLIQRGKALYRVVTHWLEDADIDFHLDETHRKKEKPRNKRWD